MQVIIDLSNKNMSKHWLLIIGISVLLPLQMGCNKNGSSNGTNGGPPPPDANPGLPSYVSVTPQNTGDGWSVSTPDAEGMDTQKLLAELQTVQNYPKVDAIVVVKNGKVIAETYLNGYGPDTLHDLRSASKSITSALTGIAIEQGVLSTEDKLADLVDLNKYKNPDARKASINVLDLLNMNSGLACDDWNAASPGQEDKMYETDDWIKFVLDLPMTANPGASQSTYCTAGVILLGSIVSSRTKMNLDDFASRNLFGPLGIQNTNWRRSPDGKATGGGGLRLRPRDFAKFGQLYLNQGMRDGKQIIPAQWVEKSKQSMTTIITSQPNGYGLLWWKRSFYVRGGTQEAFFASGNGGNFIFIFPQEQLAVTFTGSNYQSRLTDQPFDIIAQRILPTLR